jgi:FMN-dependent NADH-azoreductase
LAYPERRAALRLLLPAAFRRGGKSAARLARLKHGRVASHSCTGKKVYLVIASGGIYSVGPAMPHDFQMPYLKYVLGVIGLTDVEVIRVEGHAYGPEAAEKAISEALSKVAGVAIAA